MGLMHLYHFIVMRQKLCTTQNLRSTAHGSPTKCVAGHFWPAWYFQKACAILCKQDFVEAALGLKAEGE